MHANRNAIRSEAMDLREGDWLPGAVVTNRVQVVRVERPNGYLVRAHLADGTVREFDYAQPLTFYREEGESDA
jgi:hypothetical protein